MKPLIIYHADCTDGFAAAFAAWLKFGDEASYAPANYGDAALLLPKSTADSDFNAVYWLNRDIYILDFSLPKQSMDRLFAHAKRVVWLDHHKTAFEMYVGSDLEERVIAESGGLRVGEAPKPETVREVAAFPGKHHVHLHNDKSGALLAWEYFHPGVEVPMLIQHIDDRDRWQFKLEGSKELHAALASLKPWSFLQWDEIYTSESYPATDDGSFYSLLGEGAAILRAQDAHVQFMLKQARKLYLPVWPEGHVVTKEDVAARHGLALNTPSHMSEVGHELANASGTFGLVYYIGSDNKVKCSLRSNGEYDVSAIAKSFGGGGHRNAAGFETDIETLMGWLQ